MDLREEFERETGSNAYSQGFQHKLYNEKYVEWLEQRLDAGQHETIVSGQTDDAEILLEALEKIAVWSDEDDYWDDPGECAMDALTKYRYKLINNAH